LPQYVAHQEFFPYAGLDQFGRVINNLWCKYSSPSGAVDQIQYGYDQVGNRTFRRNVVAAMQLAAFAFASPVKPGKARSYQCLALACICFFSAPF
jgi:hypothetical protein